MKPWTRRQILEWGLIGAGVTGAAIAGQTWIRRSTSRVRIPELPETTTDSFNPMSVLRDFNSGTIKDVITMGTAERHILEFSYPYPGEYMFHPHQDAIAENGCMGKFDVIPL